SLPQPVGAAFGAPHLLGLEQIEPGGLGIVEPEAPFAAFDKTAGHLLLQFPVTFVSAGSGLTQQALGFFEAPLVEGLFSLPESEPRESKHEGVSFCFGHQAPVGQAFRPDVRMESLTYGGFVE